MSCAAVNENSHFALLCVDTIQEDVGGTDLRNSQKMF